MTALALVRGSLVVAAGVAAAVVAHHWAGMLNVLTLAVLLGVLVRTSGRLPAPTAVGASLVGKHLLRVGVVLLGLRLSVTDVLDLGWETLVVVVATVLLTFVGTRWLGGRLGLPASMSLLIATGFSICGASAVAAMSEVREHEEEDVATAIALVTLCGSLAIIVMPLLQRPLGLSPEQYGLWVGASVHDVGQVVATANAVGVAALTTAVVVKLIRVAMLAPMVAGQALAARRERVPLGSGPPLVPLFVLAFLAAIVLRSAGVLPAAALDAAVLAQTATLAAGLFALGLAVDVRSLARTGRRAAGLGALSWVLVAGVAYAGVLLTS